MARALDRLEEARAKLNEHAWSEAFDLLARCDLASPLEAEDLEGMAEAAWWTARLDDCLTARERAFELYQNGGKEHRAAFVAILIAKDFFAKGQPAIAQAWFVRAERMLEDSVVCIESGYLERTRSVLAYEGRGDYEAALAHAEKAIEIGAALKDKDLVALSIFDKGRSLVGMRRLDEGIALMDEATIAAVSGELTPLTTGFIYCNMITTCEELADFRRAADWTEASRRWCERQAIAGFPGQCRVHRAGIIRLRGDYQEAQREAEQACEEVRFFNRSYAAEGSYELGRIRFEMGLFEEADSAFRQAHEMGRDPQPGLALLQLRRGKPQAALTSLTRAVDDEHRELFLARLLPALVEIQIANDELKAAAATSERLDAIAQTFGTPALRASAHTARARVTLARSDAAEAAREARRARTIWTELEIPYEAARARVVLAEAYAQMGDDDAAELERAAAQTTFSAIGAVSEIQSGAEPNSGATRCVFRKEGDYWTIESAGRTMRLRDSKGLRHLARLVQAPRSQIHALDLVSAEEGTGAPGAPTRADGLTASKGTGDAGAQLDPQAKAAYRDRLKELQAEIDESEEWGDHERASRAQAEMEMLTEELTRAVGLGGRDRKAASSAERARINVTRSIRAALEKIGRHDERLARSLNRATQTGIFCAYNPEPDLKIELYI